MNDPGPVNSGQRTVSKPVFVSYATADRKQALAVCRALEARGTRCWISCRDVQPGENYQEAIVRTLRSSRATVLVFSEAANNSDEIKKELSLASRYHVPVMALRIEDVEPSDAFAYELSTRQWIDAFEGWDKSIDALAGRIEQLPGADPAAAPSATAPRRPGLRVSRPTMIGIAVILLVAVAGAIWWSLRPAPAVAHTMMVRLSGFQRLSPDLPPTMPEMIGDEIVAAFGDEGVIGVSTASAPAPGSAPAYALGGTVRRDGDQVRVITRLTNERSGATLWSDSFDYDARRVSRIPRRIAVEAGNMVHCGLFGASTYGKSLPDAVMTDYMKFCQNSWWNPGGANPAKALDSARKVAAAAPDFSWGWSAITVAAELSFFQSDPGPSREEVRNLGLQAADRALALDQSNSEALAQKSLLIDRADWSGQEALLKRAVAARPLFCGCEHFLYGAMLQNVGRFADSVAEMRRSVDMLALDGISQFGLADALLVVGKPDEAKLHFDAAFDLIPQPDLPASTAAGEAPMSGDYAGGIKALGDPRLQMPEKKRAAVLAGFQAMARNDAGAKTQAAQALIALSADDKADSMVVTLLGALGANREALQIIQERTAKGSFGAPSWLWSPSMRGALGDPAFPAMAERLGLMKYWRASRTRPDVCATHGPPPFCRTI